MKVSPLQKHIYIRKLKKNIFLRLFNVRNYKRDCAYEQTDIKNVIKIERRQSSSLVFVCKFHFAPAEFLVLSRILKPLFHIWPYLRPHTELSVSRISAAISHTSHNSTTAVVECLFQFALWKTARQNLEMTLSEFFLR